jgi:hypothetical protein
MASLLVDRGTGPQIRDSIQIVAERVSGHGSAPDVDLVASMSGGLQAAQFCLIASASPSITVARVRACSNSRTIANMEPLLGLAAASTKRAERLVLPSATEIERSADAWRDAPGRLSR